LAHLGACKCSTEKIYVAGSRKDIQVPMRRITLTDTIGELAEKNDPVYVNAKVLILCLM
jgi:hypothetical protein